MKPKMPLVKKTSQYQDKSDSMITLFKTPKLETLKPPLDDNTL